MHDAVSLYMDAPAERIWRLVSDVTAIGRFSPETFEAEWLDGATEPALGARFRGHVRRNGYWPPYWTTCTVVACDPGRSFGFAVGKDGGVVNTWRYRLDPQGDGTEVTESFELSDTPALRLYWMVAGRLRGRTNRGDADDPAAHQGRRGGRLRRAPHRRVTGLRGNVTFEGDRRRGRLRRGAHPGSWEWSWTSSGS